MRFAIEPLQQTPVAKREIELIERKGLGHPDTVCDQLVEAISCALNRMYLDRIGHIPHYNIDKAMLAAGQCEKRFGSGRVTQPMRLIVGDRATFSSGGVQLPVAETVHDAVEAWVRQNLPHVRPSTDLRTELALAVGSEALRSIYADPRAEVTANDTSGACGYAPLSPTEELVLDLEHFLNGSEFKAAFPDTGQDVKVFAVRHGHLVELTVAMPFLCTHIDSEAAYFRRKEEVLHDLTLRFQGRASALRIALNSLDQRGRGLDGMYLSYTGTSAEDADSGQVGRGNRANGLIAFARPTGGEAAPGKNPVAHVGKIYSVLSHLIAREIQAACPQLEEVYVNLAARIGEPVDKPWAFVQVVLPPLLDIESVRPAAREVVETRLARLAEFREELIRGEHPVC